MNFESDSQNSPLLATENTPLSSSTDTDYGLDLDSIADGSNQLQSNLVAGENLELEPTIAPTPNGDNAHQLVFIDSTVEDSQTLVDNISGAAEVVVLDSDRDELIQISEHLSNYEDLDAVHIVSHGESGQLSFANATLNSDTLPKYEQVLEDWSLALDSGADLLLYGCDVADGEGDSFVREISQVTNADVAASVNDTGIDGDWSLETTVGEVEATSVFGDGIASAYQHNLADAFIRETVGGGDSISDDGSGTLDDFDDQVNDELSGGGDDSEDSDGEDEDSLDLSFTGKEFFDAELYLEQNPDVAEAGADPLQHYVEFGFEEGRDPNSSFDTSYYLEQNPDVADAGANPLQHYYEFGREEGRSPNEVFKNFADSEVAIIASANSNSNGIELINADGSESKQFESFKETALELEKEGQDVAVAVPLIYYFAAGAYAFTVISLEALRQSNSYQEAINNSDFDYYVSTQSDEPFNGPLEEEDVPLGFPTGEGEVNFTTPPFDLGAATQIDPKTFPKGDNFLQDALDGQFEFPDAEEGGVSFLASSPISGLSDSEYNALRETGLSEPEISEQFELLGDIYVFRGTSEGFPGNPALERLGISPASVDPLVATIFAVESNTKGGNGVVLYGSQEGFGNPAVEQGNVRSTLEREVSVGLTPTDFAAAAPNSISVDRARQILQEIGLDIPSSLDADAARNLLENTPKLTPQQVQEFINKAASPQ